jgi:sterol desaturase/sphingolipid hydroxylase (fatty acid hydroxylase superfamily)
MSNHLSEMKKTSSFSEFDKTVLKQVLPKNKGKKQLFQNPYLEQLTRTHILVPIGIFVSFAYFLLYYGSVYKDLSWGLLAGLFGIGMLVFTFVEYLVHRYVFHLFADTPQKANFQYKFHGVHHEYPKDKDRLAMPPILSALIICLLFGFYYLVMGNLAYGFTAGFAVGYASYLGVHYMVHAFPPPKNVFKLLWINHGIHHYKDEHVAFGVSSPLWDWIFGTLPR